MSTRKLNLTETETEITNAVKKHCIDELSLNALGARLVAKETIRAFRRILGTKRYRGSATKFLERHAARPRNRSRR